MDIKELNKKLQFEFMSKHYKATKKVEQIKDSLSKIPAYQKICSLERQLVFDVAKNQFDKKTNSELKKNLKLIREQKQKLLAKLKVKTADLEPKFECQKCQDLGFIGSEMCDCFKARLNEELLKQSGFNISSMASFETFDTKICSNKKQAENLNKLKDILCNWAESYPNIKKKNLTLCGTAGVGKTYLSECLANKLVSKNYSVCFVSAFDMNNMFLKYHTCFDSNKNIHISPLLHSKFLFIDDLGTEPIMKNVTLNYLYLILSERERHDLPVIITTNLTPSNILDRYGERIYSRIANKHFGAFFHLEGDDLRLTTK